MNSAEKRDPGSRFAPVCEAPRTARCDVLVIGGGPAGSTIAALLAARGWHVVVLEKQYHPRFHIGESLLPMNTPIFERLGVLDEVRRIGVPKYGAQFNSVTDTERAQTFYFSDAAGIGNNCAYEVQRAEFDHMLLLNSSAKGAQVYEGIRVTDVLFQKDMPSRIQALDTDKKNHTWIADYVVDASGRETLLAKKFGYKRAERKHSSAALFGHFRNVLRLPGRDAGNLSVYWFAQGWLWLIPLPGGIASIGAVCSPSYLKSRTGDRAEFLWATIRGCPSLNRRMQGAELVSPVSATGNYSYYSKRLYGPGWLLVGDAFAFVDPVFSTGVFVAMDSASIGADAVDACLRQAPCAARRLKAYDRRLRGGVKTINWFIYRFNSPGLYALFMAPNDLFGMRTAVLSVLAGDLFEKAGIKLALVLFKLAYYLAQVGHYLRTWPVIGKLAGRWSGEHEDGYETD